MNDDFNLFHVGKDGNIDSKGLGLGFAPTTVTAGEKYVVRVKLTLAKPCLGIAFDFGITVSH